MTDEAVPDPVELAQRLIRCPSVTPAEGGALSVIADALSGAGFSVHRPVFSEPGTPDVENLYARFGTERPCFVFAGHTDVVPPGDVAAWRHDPFSGAIDGDELHGRGAVDMKGAIACMLAATLAFLAERGQELQGSIAFLITGDEEGPSVNGTAKLLDWARERGERLDHCLLGEPTNPAALGEMIKIGRRGSLTGRLTVRGRQGHVAYPHLAENPVPALLRLLSALIATPLDEGSEHFDASHLEITTVDIANSATNVIPAEARAVFNIRFNDQWTPDSLAAEIARRLTDASQGARYALVFDPNPSSAFRTEAGPFVGLVAYAAEAETGRRPALSTTGGTSDARFITNVCPVLEFGLVGQTMHAVDERVATGDLHKLTTIYRRVLDRYFFPGHEARA